MRYFKGLICLLTQRRARAGVPHGHGGVARVRFSPFLLAVALSPVLLQTSTCTSGDTTLSELSLFVDDQDHIVDFDSTQRDYEALLPLGTEEASVHAVSTDPDAQVWVDVLIDGERFRYLHGGLGGGDVIVSLPQGPSTVEVWVRPPGGATDAYDVAVQVGPPCTEQCVTAEPTATTFNPTIQVTLRSLWGEPIFYTTDLSPVLDQYGDVQGIEYTGPIALAETTVLKFLTGSPGDYSVEQAEGYTLAETPIREQWAQSGHGDLAAGAWRHWDEDGSVPARCARCHGPQPNPPLSGPAPPDIGLLEYLATGTNFSDSPLPFGIDCVSCHQTFPTIYSNLAKFRALEPVRFPSGAQVSLYGPSNICMSCHQGRTSGQNVQDAIDYDNGLGPYSFINIHYYAASASLFGSETLGGFEYEPNWYRPRNTFPSHPDSYSNCVGCHMINAKDGEMHTWIPDVDSCIGCHGGTSFQTLGGTPGQSFSNIETLEGELLAQIQNYAANVIGVPIEYNPNQYPYYFEGETGLRYQSFDATLLKAAYNYQVSGKDPAGYIHNGAYVQQLLHDSIVDLGGTPSLAVIGRGERTIGGAAIGAASKTEQWWLGGHAAADSERFRHWDEDYLLDGYTPEGVAAACTRCHSTPGFMELAQGDVPTSTMPTTTVDCWSCHNDFDLFANAATRYDDAYVNPALASVVFPSGDSVSLGNASNICMACHQGRSSKVQVDNATPNGTVQTPTDYDSYNFINIHYYAAAATFLGTEVRGGYEYAGYTYRGRNTFVGLHTFQGRTLVDCIGCHMNASEDADGKQRHTFLPQIEDCNLCHNGQDFEVLSGSPGDNYREINVLLNDLYAAIQNYAINGLPQASPIYYDTAVYPFWFEDNGMGSSYSNRYTDFDFAMLTAAYNYHVALKDPAGYIHNAAYVEQLLFDSVCAMGGTPRVVTVADRPASCP